MKKVSLLVVSVLAVLVVACGGKEKELLNTQLSTATTTFDSLSATFAGISDTFKTGQEATIAQYAQVLAGADTLAEVKAIVEKKDALVASYNALQERYTKNVEDLKSLKSGFESGSVDVLGATEKIKSLQAEYEAVVAEKAKIEGDFQTAKTEATALVETLKAKAAELAAAPKKGKK